MPSITVDLIYLSIAFILSTVVSFNVGYFVCHIRTKRQAAQDPVKGNAVIKKKIVLKAKNNKEKPKAVVPKPSVPSSASGVEEVKTYEPTIEKAINVLHSIIGTPQAMYNEYDLQRSWHLVSNNSHFNFFSSKDKDDGILIRCSTYMRNTTPASIVKWMLESDVITGLEGVTNRCEIIRKLEINEENHEVVIVRRLMGRAGTLMASKRDFILVTSISAISATDESSKSSGFTNGYVIATRSVPEDFIAPQRGSKTHGYIRGLVFGCGYILTTEKDGESVGTKISYAAHVDMLGSRSARTTAAYCNMLINSTENLFQAVSVHCLADGTSAATALAAAGGDTASAVLSQQQQAALTRRNSTAFTNSSIDLSPDDREEIMLVAKSALRRLRKYHATVKSSGASGVDKKWETFHDQDGIALRKLKYDAEEAAPAMGVLSATCSIDAPPSVVRNLLIDHPDSIDALLEGRSVLNHLSQSTYVQWLAYGAMYPLGAKDFLLVTTEEEYSPDSVGFIVASTSIDDICEMADESGAEGGGGAAASAAAKKSEYNRSSLKLAGYVGVSNANGGTDLTLILDLEFPFDIPSFVLQLLCQYGLTETMRRIKNASETEILRVRQDSKLSVSSESDVSPLRKSDLAIAKARVSKAADGDSDDEHDDDEGNGGVIHHPPSDFIAPAGPQSPLSPTTAGAVEDSSNGSNSAAVTPSSSKTNAGSHAITEEALSRMKAYLQLAGCNSSLCDVEWTLKINKPTIAVFGGVSPTSTWGAIKAVTKMKGDPQQILKLLTDDNRIGEYDEMFDFFKFIANVDERSNIRRVCFKAVWPTAPRDFLICTTHEVQPDGSILIATVSVPDSHFAQQKGYVRGNIRISGYHIQPYVEGAPAMESCSANGSGCSDFIPTVGECRLTLTAHTELGGTLPVSVINMLSTNAPVKIVSCIADIMKKCS